MHRLSNGTQASVMPAPAPPIGVPGYATGGNVGSQPPSDIDPDTYNAIQEELCGVIESAQIQLSKTDNTQLLRALNALFVAQPVVSSVVSAAGDDIDMTDPDRLLSALNTLYLKNSDFKNQMQSTLSTFSDYHLSGDIQFPSWATRFEAYCTGAGGGGSGCQGHSVTESVSGSGGGSGGTIYAVILGKPGDVLTITVGAPGSGGSGSASGTAGQPGGGTSCSLNGKLLLTAGGGKGGRWNAGFSSSGGSSGLCTLADNNALTAWTLIEGADGSDGQAAAFLFAGNGGASYWGGGGRAGSGMGNAGLTWGSGGGAAYDPNYTGNSFSGGAGCAGIIWGRFLP